MPASRLPFEPRYTGAEVLVAARFLDPGRRSWLRNCHPAVTAAGRRWTIVAPEGPDLSRLQEELPGAAFVAVPPRGVEFPLWRALRPLVASGRYAAAHALDLSAAGHASLACLGTQVPLVVSVPHPPEESRYSGLVGSLERWLLGRALAAAAAIVAAGEEAREGVLRLFPNLRASGNRIHTILDGVDIDPYEQDEVSGTPLRRELELDDETLLVGQVGPLTTESGFPLLLDAVARLVRFGGVPPFHVAAFGEGAGEGWDEVIARLGVKEHVTLLEPGMELPSVLEQLDVLAIPTVRAATPRLAMEALCAGVPVLASDCPGLREALHGSPSRLVRPGVLAALETGLRQALAAPWFEEAAAFAPLARRRFDHRPGAARLARLYDELTGRAAPARQPELAAGG